MKKIGVIGLGIMGHGIAANFLRAGCNLSIWNRSKERTIELIENGAILLKSPKEVTENSDIIIECVADDEASRSVWLGINGILAGATPDKVLTTSASLSLDWTDELSRLCQNNGFRFLDMPLTGSRMGAETGTLKLLVGGDSVVLDEIRSELTAIADKVYHFGPAGAGMRFKLVLNTLQAIHMKATAQAIELFQKAGLDIEQVHHAIFDAPMGPASPTTNLAFLNIDSDQVNFPLKLIEKDLRYAQDMAKQYNMEFDLLNDTQADYERAKVQSLGDQDWTIIKQLYRHKS